MVFTSDLTRVARLTDSLAGTLLAETCSELASKGVGGYGSEPPSATTVASFINSYDGGALLIGVVDDGHQT